MLGPSVTGEIAKQWTAECEGKPSREAAQLEASVVVGGINKRSPDV